MFDTMNKQSCKICKFYRKKNKKELQILDNLKVDFKDDKSKRNFFYSSSDDSTISKDINLGTCD